MKTDLEILTELQAKAECLANTLCQLHKNALAMCIEIEKLPASEQQTKVSLHAAALCHDLQALTQ